MQRNYRGVPAEQRTAERRRRLVDAGGRSLGEGGLAATTMTGVCARAKLTERYFYESFANLEELLLAVLDNAATELEMEVFEAMDAAPEQPRAKLRAAVSAYAVRAERDPTMIRAILVESLGSPALRARRHEHVHRFAELATEYAGRYYGVTLPAGRAKLGGVLLVGGLSEAAMSWQAGELDVGWAEIVDAVVDEFDALARR